MRNVLIGVLAVATTLNVAPAQVSGGPRQEPGGTADPVPMERLFLGGAAGLGAAILGTHLAYQAGGGGRNCGDDSCGLAAGITALLLLEPILVPAGVHLANHRRGSFAGTFFGSLLSGATALYIGNKLDLGVEFVYVGAALQIATSALFERAGEKERIRR
jgi:hypothetical protein